MKDFFNEFKFDLQFNYFRIALLIFPFCLIFFLIFSPIFTNYKIIQKKFLLVIFIKILQSVLTSFAFLTGFILMKLSSKGQSEVKQKRSDIIEVYKTLFANIGIYLRVVLKKDILVLFGFMFFMIPGYYLSTIWYLVYPCLVDDIRQEPFKRSSDLLKGRYFNIVCLIFVLFLILLLAIIFSMFFENVISTFSNNIQNPKIIQILGFSIFGLLCFPILIVFDYNLFKYYQKNIIK